MTMLYLALHVIFGTLCQFWHLVLCHELIHELSHDHVIFGTSTVFTLNKGQYHSTNYIYSEKC